jgi:hypothetical protein
MLLMRVCMVSTEMSVLSGCDHYSVIWHSNDWAACQMKLLSSSWYVAHTYSIIEPHAECMEKRLAYLPFL